MGGRNISTTKSGKFMNPTDQARKFVYYPSKIRINICLFSGKEARKKELKKNKKQRLLVRQSVLKGKNPKSLIAEMEHLDRMEYDPVNPAPYNIKVLQEKRKKIKETWDRVYRLYVSKTTNKYSRHILVFL
jgi:WW domain-binding protein 11